MIRTYIFIFILIYSSFGLTQKIKKTEIHKIELINKEGIQYVFPDSIQFQINNIIKMKENEFHFLELMQINDSTFSLLLSSIKRKNWYKKNLLISQTGRYYHYQKKKIPIYFNMDYTFSAPDFSIFHADLYLKFVMINKKSAKIIFKELN